MKRPKTRTVGEQIIEGLEEALAFQRGGATGARVTRVRLTAPAARVKPA